MTPHNPPYYKGLIEACDDFERQLPEHTRSQAELIDFYLGSLREADRLQREFEQAMGDFLGPIWKSRSPSDTQTYALVREPSAPTN